MNCQRCGRRGAATTTFVVNQSTAESWKLREQCCENMVSRDQRGWARTGRANPAGTIQQVETNLERSLTPAERADVERCLAQPTRSSRPGGS